MLNKKIMFLVPGMVLGAVVSVVDVAAADMVETRVNVGRQEVLFQGDSVVKKANAKMLKGLYREAIKDYQQALSIYRPYESGKVFRGKIEYCKRRISDAYYEMAEEAMANADKSAFSNDFELAIKLCREAQEFCPERKEELAERISHYERRRAAAVNRGESSITKLSPAHKEQEYQIQLLLEQGRSMLRRNELVKAKKRFEEILLIDPFNADALQNLLGINTRIRKDAKMRANATARHMVGEVEWANSIPIVPDAPVGELKNELDTPVVKAAVSELEVRLKNLKLKKNFVVDEGMLSFAEVMQLLKDVCRQSDEKRRDVNFVIKFAPRASNAQPALLRMLTMPRGSSVLDILHELQNRGDLTFKIDNNSVLIAEKGVPLEKMRVQLFPFALENGDDPEGIKNRLEAEGVNFGPDATVSLVKKRNHVIVRNTPAELKKVAVALENMRTAVPMVQIMFKFLEISQKDLDELGFNWNYARPMTGSGVGYDPEKMFNSSTPEYAANTRPAKKDGFSVDKNSNALLRHYGYNESNRFDGGPYKGDINDANFSFEWYDSKNYLSASIYALDWADSTDILYSPRVTTLADTKAVIDMSEKHYYPDEWETIDSESGDDFRIKIEGAQPDLSDEQDLGIKFEITPSVDGRLISAEVNIPILQFDGWMVVDTRPENASSDSDSGEYIRKPILTDRTIKTKVTLKDGETVLIGSVVQDLTKSIDDKIPILGDIPFIGRFFQSKYTSSQKNNLLVFMTCRLVKPDGSALYPEADNGNNGLPKFPQNY